MKRELANPGKSAYLIYTDWMRTLMDMPGEIRAKINDALYLYCLYREEPEDPMVKYSMFALMKKTLDDDEAKFEDKMQRKKSARSEAGKKGMQKRYSKNLKENEVSNKTNTDTVTVTDTVTQNLNSLNLCVDSGSNTHNFEKFKALSEYEESQYEYYKIFIDWVITKTPLLTSLIPPTEKQFAELKREYGSDTIGKVCEDLNNQPHKVEKYRELYRTLKIWLKTETDYQGKQTQREDRFSARRGTQPRNEVRKDFKGTL